MTKYSFFRFAKHAIILAVAVFGVGLTTAHADSFTTVNVSGTFAGGTTLSGTLTIDVTTGVITAANLSTSGAVSFSFSCSSACSALIDQGGDGPNGYSANFMSGDITLSLIFFTSDGTLINYSGGIFCIGSAPGCGDPSELFGDSMDTLALTSGSATSNVPEPSTYLLLCTGLIGLGLIARKRIATGV